MTDFDLTPVSTEAPMEPVLRKGIGLCLSGGGYRAMLFHLGVVWRLAELGYLGTEHRWGKHGELGSLQRVSSVSGGSITAGVLGRAVQANLVELDAVPEDAADYAMCLFSTLGMIQGRENRRRALRHARRILKPGGVFVIHAHNFWFNLFDPGGPWWVLGSLLRSTFRADVERGDKYFAYRGVPNMFLHVFTRRELIGNLKRAGFRVREVIPLHVSRQKRLPHAWLFGRIRANGWIVVCS